MPNGYSPLAKISGGALGFSGAQIGSSSPIFPPLIFISGIYNEDHVVEGPGASIFAAPKLVFRHLFSRAACKEKQSP